MVKSPGVFHFPLLLNGTRAFKAILTTTTGSITINANPYTSKTWEIMGKEASVTVAVTIYLSITNISLSLQPSLGMFEDHVYQAAKHKFQKLAKIKSDLFTKLILLIY